MVVGLFAAYGQVSGISSVVGVAEWLRRQVVALEIEGSNPSVHPIDPT